jgi:hydroxyacylglutathione hydrolase
MHIEQFFSEGLGHQSYFVLDQRSHVAAVVDPRPEIVVYLQAADAANAQITSVFETHVHNYYSTGACELRERTSTAQPRQRHRRMRVATPIQR